MEVLQRRNNKKMIAAMDKISIVADKVENK